MAQLITVHLNKSDQQPLGFRLQGGKDFGTPLVVQKVNGGSAAERAGLQAGDALIRVNNTEVYTLRHQEAQDTIRAAGTILELTVQRGGNTWRPSVTPTGSLPRAGSRPLGAAPIAVTNTSLKATPQPSRAFGSGHNNVAKPFGYMNGSDSVKSIVNKQYNTPVNIYSDKTIAETLSAQTEVLAGGVLGVNFKKNEKTYDAEKSAVFKVLQEEQNDPEPEPSHFYSRASVARAGTPCSLHRTHRSRSRTPHVASGPRTPTPRAPSPPPPRTCAGTQTPCPEPERATLPVGCHEVLPDGRVALGAPAAPQPGHDPLPVINDTPYCSDCNRYIIGVFVRIKDKNLHVECFKCSTCGTSLKNQGYYNLNGKLYCDIHAKLVARQNPPAPNLEPVTVPPGGRIPTNAYSTPLPPLATNNYTNGSSSLFSPNSNISGPKPFGSSIGSAYSPSLSPRSAPLSPARPLAAPAPAPVAAPALVTAPAPAPYAPTQNVKSIVWPPPNPPDNIVSPIDSSEPKSTNIIDESIPQTMQIERESTKNIDNLCHIDNIHQKTTQQTLSSSKQFSEFASSVSCASATLSAGATASTKLESLSKSKQSSETHESTCVIQSFSEKESSEKQSVNIYHSKTSAPVEKLYENTLNNTNECVQNTEKIEHTANKSEPLIDQQSSKTESSYTEQFHNETMNLQKKIETSSFPTNIQDVQENKQEPLKINENEFQNNSNNDKSCYENISTISNKDNKIEISNNVNISINSATQSVVQGTGLITSMRDALTTAPDHPYSPLPSSNLINSDTKIPNELHIDTSVNKTPDTTEISNVQLPQISQPSPIFIQQSKRGISPIPPITMYTPPEQKQVPIPMPEESQPYIPPDFKINIETKVSREETSSPMVEALTTAPNRSFTPVQIPTIQRGSLRDALTIAPDQPYTSLNIKNQSTSYTSTSSTVQSTVTDILKPIATQSSTCVTNKTLSEFSNSIQNTCQLQSSTDMSAFRPVTKQIFPPLQPEEFCQLSNFPPISDDLKSSFKQSINSKQETVTSETIQHCAVTSSMCTQGFSSIKNAQNYFEQLNQKESLSSINIRSKSGLHKPDDIPLYQKNFERLPSQRGITPEICTAPAVLQRPVTPTTDPPNKSRDKSLEPKQNMNIASPQMQVSKHHQLRTPVQQTPNQFCHKDTPISMTFQPVIDDNLLTISPGRSRPTTPSLINKPAPIIPHYQMNLVTVEYSAPESHLYEPSSREASRSPTPKARSRSPAPGPPPNPLKAQAPRLKETTPQRHGAHSLLTQATSNLRKENEMSQKEIKRNTEVLNPTQSCISGQPLTTKEEKYSNFGYNREHYNKGDLNITEDAVVNQNYGKKQTQSHNVSEYGNKTVQTTRKTFEEFEKTQSAKVIEIRKGAPSSEMYQQPESNIRPSNVNFNQVFPPPVISTATIQHSSANLTNESVVTTSRSIENYQTNPSISGANQGPVCDPTPSTGSSVGAAARGKAFGVSSAPKRGRGVLNKAAVPGSRVPLCASCNGNIRGPFITALGRIWCPEHFVCVNATCRRHLQDIGFVEENGQLYCEYCFEQYIAPACDKCHAKIKGDCLNAIGKHFHPECFNCVYCGKLFGNNPFFLEDGLPYCEADWNELFTTKCFACGFPVEAGDRWVEALNNNYHSQCFNCTVCKKNLEGQSFFAKGGRPFCKTHAR
ncbi:PDZ and LIM domain protein Zasp isoform X4 [Achroia grisella]|uniref:PDZ and LIM domain protein Zasp isoform X4 n=1 Tax=Achroia grisella TaxID=688607 RepID=UPI0027D23F3D|nr:PDZ and LIM domain protein Zasp isoform X4 [Achroia grisella]